MRKQYISKSEIASLLKVINNWGISIQKIKKVLSVEIEKGSILISDEFKIVMINNHILPFLADKELLTHFPSIEVDMGAVKAVCNGASIARPGIVRMDDFKKDDIVVVKDVNHKQCLAVGIALMDKDEAEKLNKGHVIKNLHYISDDFWEIYKEIRIQT
ncbi:MAG: PUA domain-containing protein [Candidatus Nitrosocaldaceae archaeon]